MDRFRGWWRPFYRELRHATVFFALAMIAVVWVGGALHLLTVRSQLLELVRLRAGVNFSPTGVLRLELSEEEKDYTLDIVRRLLLQIRADS